MRYNISITADGWLEIIAGRLKAFGGMASKGIALHYSQDTADNVIVLPEDVVTGDTPDKLVNSI